MTESYQLFVEALSGAIVGAAFLWVLLRNT